MTPKEQTQVTRLQVNQNNMSNDIHEIKQDIKEIKDLIIHLSQEKVSAKTVRWIFGAFMSLVMIAILFWNHLTGR